MIPLLLSLCLFLPPKNWEVAHPKQKGPLEIGFRDKKTNARITLATEKEVGSSLKEYVQAVKKLQQEDPHIQHWRSLGPVEMKGGKGELLEMYSGDIRIMQAILLKNGTAYILTASALKQHFIAVQSDVFKTFASLDCQEETEEIRQKNLK